MSNEVAGHARNCAQGAGADCTCHVGEREAKESAAKARDVYRALKTDSGLSWADFTSSCTVLVDDRVEKGEVWSTDADDVAWAFVAAGRIVAEYGIKIVNVAADGLLVAVR